MIFTVLICYKFDCDRYSTKGPVWRSHTPACSYTSEVRMQQIEELGGGTENITLKVKICQFPVTVNHATTGHKLQGKTAKGLIIAEWARRTKNWIYVVLSRVKTLKGLFLMTKLPTEVETAPDPLVTQMMARLRESIAVVNDSPLIASIRVSL